MSNKGVNFFYIALSRGVKALRTNSSGFCFFAFKQPMILLNYFLIFFVSHDISKKNICFQFLAFLVNIIHENSY